MSWEIIYSQRAQRDLRRLDRATAIRVVRAIERLAASEHGDLRQIAGIPDELRFRVGSWRVRLRFAEQTAAIEILRILHRSEAHGD